MDGKQLQWVVQMENFRPKSIFSTEFSGCITATEFVEKFHNSTFHVATDEDVISRSTPFEDTNSNRETTPLKETVQRKVSTPETSLIKRKFVGKFTVPLHVLKTPEGKRKVRHLNEQFVSDLSNKMLKSKDINMQCAPAITGYINVSASDFSEEKLKNGEYDVEAIDGNHSLHAQRTALLVADDKEMLQTREVAIYCQLTDDECAKIGVSLNRRTATSAAMTELDYLLLLRRKLMTFSNNDEPPEKVPEEFSDFMHSLMDLKTVSV